MSCIIGQVPITLESRTKFSPSHKLDRCRFPRPFQVQLKFIILHTTNNGASSLREGQLALLMWPVRIWPVLQTELAKTEQRVSNSGYPKHQAKQSQQVTGSVPVCFLRTVAASRGAKTTQLCFQCLQGPFTNMGILQEWLGLLGYSF